MAQCMYKIKYFFLLLRGMPKFLTLSNNKFQYLQIYIVTMINHFKIKGMNNVIKSINKFFVRKKLLFTKKYKIKDIQKLYFDLASINNFYNCFDYAILFAQIYSNKNNNTKIVFGVYKDNNKVIGHAWVEIGYMRIIDFTGAYMYCNTVWKYKI